MTQNMKTYMAMSEGSNHDDDDDIALELSCVG
jgi:hypothetical protein